MYLMQCLAAVSSLVKTLSIFKFAVPTLRTRVDNWVMLASVPMRRHNCWRATFRNLALGFVLWAQAFRCRIIMFWKSNLKARVWHRCMHRRVRVCTCTCTCSNVPSHHVHPHGVTWSKAAVSEHSDVDPRLLGASRSCLCRNASFYRAAGCTCGSPDLHQCPAGPSECTSSQEPRDDAFWFWCAQEISKLGVWPKQNFWKKFKLCQQTCEFLNSTLNYFTLHNT